MMKEIGSCRWLTAIALLAVGVFSCSAFGAATHATPGTSEGVAPASAAPSTAAVGAPVGKFAPGEPAADNQDPGVVAGGEQGVYLATPRPLPPGFSYTPSTGGARGSLLVYQNTTARFFYTGDVDDTWVADDAVFEGPQRTVTEYEVSSYGHGTGTFTMTTWLAYDIEGATTTDVPDSTCVFPDLGGGTTPNLCVLGTPQCVSQPVYVVMEVDNWEEGAWLISDEAEVGFTEDNFCLEDPRDPEGQPLTPGCGWWFSGDPYAGFEMQIWADPDSGPCPGACCRAFCSGSGDPCSLSADCPEGQTCDYGCEDDLLEGDCTGPGARFGEFAECRDNPFIPPCGIGACCRSSGCTFASNMTESRCFDILSGLAWFEGIDCDPNPCESGACCFVDGSCEDQGGDMTELECVALGGIFASGEACVDSPCDPPCEQTCTDNEGEPCDDSGEGRLNDGCNEDTPTPEDFGSIAANGGTVCGTAWAKDGTRDTDWHVLTGLADADTDGDGYAELTITINSQIPITTFLIADTGSDCEDLDILVNGTDPCAIAYGDACTDASYTVCVPVNVPYYVWLGPGSEAGGAIYEGLGCGYLGGGKYQITATVNAECNLPCCDVDGVCTMVASPAACDDCGSEITGECGDTCLDVTCPPRPANNCCEDAILVGATSSISGSTTGATSENQPFCAGMEDSEAGSVYYKVIGTGNTITATMCNSPAPYDAMMFVYCIPDGGDCDTLACVGADDDGCGASGDGVPSVVSFCTEFGREYIIMITGWSDAEGDFLLELSDDGIECEAAPCELCFLDCTEGTPEGEEDCSTLNGGCNAEPPVFSPVACGETICGTVSFEGGTRDTDWYEIVITETTFLTWIVEAEFTVLMGIVDNGGVDDCSTVEFIDPAETGQPCQQVFVEACVGPGTYWLFVAPDFDDNPDLECGAEYQATLLCGCCDIECDEAADPEGEVVCFDEYDDMTNAGCSGLASAGYHFTDVTCPALRCGTSGVHTVTDLPCDTDDDCPGAETCVGNVCTGGPWLSKDLDWYRLTVAEDSLVTATLRAEFTAIVQLYAEPGSECVDTALLQGAAAIDCVPACVSDCVPSGTYYVVVFPAFFDGADCGVEYELAIDCEAMTCPTAAPVNDDCANAVAVADGTVPFTTVMATTDGPSECEITADIWYAYTASCSGQLEVTTCDAACFDTMLGLYSGECGTLVEEACNDDAEGGVCGVTSTATMDVTAGDPILIRLGGFEGDVGYGELTISCLGLNLTGVSSCVDHSGTEYCLDLTAVNVEPRLGGIRKLIATTDNDAPSSPVASIDCGSGPVAGVSAAVGGAANEIVIDINPALPDLTCCELTIAGVTGSAFVVGAQGNVNQDGVTSTIDSSAVKARFGQATDAGNYRYDINGDGVISSIDFSAIKARWGTPVAPCP